MSLCSAHQDDVAAPSPRSPRAGTWTAKAVLDALSEGLCKFLDSHYFGMSSPFSEDDIVANSKADEIWEGEGKSKGGVPDGSILVHDDVIFAPDHLKAEMKLAAYEAVVLELPPTPVVVDEEAAPTDKELTVAVPESVEKTKATKKAPKAAGGKKGKKGKSLANVPRAVALNPAAAKPKAAATLRKPASMRKVSAKPVRV